MNCPCCNYPECGHKHTPEPVVSASPTYDPRTDPNTNWVLDYAIELERIQESRNHVLTDEHGNKSPVLTRGTIIDTIWKYLAAAQPVANPKEVMPTETEPRRNTETHSEPVTEASLKTSGLANPPKVEEIAERLINAMLNNWYRGVAQIRVAFMAILGPLFTQVSQPPTEILTDLMLELHHALDMGGKLTLPVQIQMKKADEYLNGLVPKLAAPVTPVSPTPANEIIHACTCKEPSQEFPCRVCNRRDEVTK